MLRYLCSQAFLSHALLVGLTLAALEGVCRNGFVKLDDPIYVEQNMRP